MRGAARLTAETVERAIGARTFPAPREFLVPFRCTRDERNIPCALAVTTGRDYAALFEDQDTVLHASEKTVFRSFTYEKRRREYLLSRAAAKAAVGALLGEPEGSHIEILSGVFRQPVVCHDSKTVPEVSLSHGEHAAVAVASAPGHPLGIDLERVDSRRSDVIEETLTPSEKDWIAADGRDRAFLYAQLWTLKEALSKTLKTGMTVPFSLLEIDQPQPHGGFLRCFFKNFYQYQGHSWAVGPYVMSLVAPRKTRVAVDENHLCFSLLGARASRPQGAGETPALQG